jgi:hypothetical protein
MYSVNTKFIYILHTVQLELLKLKSSSYIITTHSIESTLLHHVVHPNAIFLGAFYAGNPLEWKVNEKDKV